MAYSLTQNYLAAITIIVVTLSLPHNSVADWRNHGADISNTRSAEDWQINRNTVSGLSLRWKFFAGKDISATPAVADGAVYFPSWNGFLYAVNAFTGDLFWRQNLSEITGLQGTGLTVNVTVSRSTPTVAGNLLIVPIYGPAVVIAVTRWIGRLVWLTMIDPRPITLAGPGGEEGGGQWGAATDVRRVYTNIVNSNRLSFRLAPSNQTTTAGAWVALDANSGEILWSTANPSNDTTQAPVSMANGVVFVGSVAPNGPIYAMDARTGKILWSYDTGATVYGGISASYGCIYLGNGYTVGLASLHPTWTPGTYIFAFCLS
ncbi:hypothetical protein CRG98_042805 [Punica granatum]|uniref:Pyrrolo-quinoline quinone repeat domain-containing protein n=1 Tax=Punica granatum TaxID=22663 RepID=A0A2I0I051_PUNGR|nr:hypothetical protein CRG98_042805 [Punica granatum]